MANLDKATVSFSRATVIGVTALQLGVAIGGAYYGNRMALKDINYKIEKVELQYQNQDALILQRLTANELKVNEAYQMVASCIGKAILPRETSVEQEKRR